MINFIKVEDEMNGDRYIKISPHLAMLGIEWFDSRGMFYLFITCCDSFSLLTLWE